MGKCPTPRRLGGVIPPGMPGHSPEIGLQFDPLMAKNLLREADFHLDTDSLPIRLAALSGFGTLPHYLQSCWRKNMGIEVEIIENISFDKMLSGFEDGSIQLALGGWYVDYPDPDNILRALFHGASPANYFGWQNNRFDWLTEQAANSTDQQARLAIYHQADRILVADETAVVPLYYPQAYGLLRDWI